MPRHKIVQQIKYLLPFPFALQSLRGTSAGGELSTDPKLIARSTPDELSWRCLVFLCKCKFIKRKTGFVQLT